MSVKGVTELTKNIDAFFNGIIEKTHKVVDEILVTGLQEAVAITPVDTGTLINSQFRRINGDSKKVVGEAGFSAYYAAFVHEKTGKLKGQPRRRKGATGNYWDDNGEPKFLEKGFTEKGLGKIKQIIIQGYKT